MKQTKLPEPLLINRITLRGPELKRIFEYIRKKGETSYVELIDRYVPKDNNIFSELNDDILKDAIGFLISSGLLEISENGRSWSVRSFRVPTNLSQEISFQNLLLKTILNMNDSKQRALSLIHKTLIEKDILHIQDSEIVKVIERSEIADIFSWNEEKINFWSNIFDFCRLIRNLKGNGVWIIPKPELILESLMLLKDQTPNFISINSWVTFFENNFGACITKKGRLHKGFAMVFELLEQNNQLKMVHKDDSIQTILIGNRRVSEVII
ncbi:MAG: hypothetical protein H7263_10760 [Candidatus Sericytochromatia bacterium]|nr:hypothetical protein [Candidatus Sericytochromatia bacterium]